MNFRKLPYLVYLAFNRSLKFLEKLQVQTSNKPLPYKPIFILGAPRCGSTLIYQNIVNTLDVAYLSNLHCYWFGAPWLLERLTNASANFRNNPVYRSRLGFTKGMYAPSECGEFWYRFFRRFPQYVDKQSVNNKKMKDLRIAMHAFLQASEKPVIIKNLLNALRLEPIIDTLPESIFIVIHRDEKDIAHSILEARKKMNGNYNDWFSLQPPNINDLRLLPPEKQVIHQIRSTYKLIEDAEKLYPDNPFFHINYEDFCQSPNDSIQSVKNFLIQNNTVVQQVGKSKSTFEMRSDVRIDPDIYKALINYLEKN